MHVRRLLGYCNVWSRPGPQAAASWRALPRRRGTPIQNRRGDLRGTDSAGANAVRALFHVDGLGQRYFTRGFAAVVSGAHHGEVYLPAQDDMLMTTPSFCVRMEGITAFVQ